MSVTQSSTTVLEPIALQSLAVTPEPGVLAPESTAKGRRLESAHDITAAPEDPLPSDHNVTTLDSWNNPRSNIYRIGASYWSLLVTGANDAAYGALIPYLETYYKLDYLVVSLVFLSPFVGYILAATCNNHIHMRFGQRGIAVICSLCHIAAYIVLSQHPPYPVLVVVFILAGFGNGVADAAWNAWIGNLNKANELLGFLHAFYGVGGTIGPLIATTMITKGGLSWYSFYYVMIGMSVIELVTCTAAFWHCGAEEYNRAIQASNENTTGMRAALFSKPYARVTWIGALFLLGYVGAEVSLGGWIVQFMIRVREAENFSAGMTSVGFWLGLTVGRAILGFVTPLLGVKLAVLIYVPAAMALELVFWLVPQFYVSAVAVALQGFFLGPLFPAVIVVMTRLLPKHLHVSAVGFVAAVGGSGGALLPFATGALAQAKGVQVLQPIILAFLGLLLVLWLCLPRIGKKRD
ncbi:hypothetical protein V2G26_019870 [Clonostachys chloroleuca]